MAEGRPWVAQRTRLELAARQDELERARRRSVQQGPAWAQQQQPPGSPGSPGGIGAKASDGKEERRRKPKDRDRAWSKIEGLGGGEASADSPRLPLLLPQAPGATIEPRPAPGPIAAAAAAAEQSRRRAAGGEERDGERRRSMGSVRSSPSRLLLEGLSG